MGFDQNKSVVDFVLSPELIHYQQKYSDHAKWQVIQPLFREMNIIVVW